MSGMLELRKKDIRKPETAKDISIVRDLLLAHLKKEEEQFYPPMRVAAQKDPGLKELLTVMGMEMDEIAKTVLDQLALWLKGEGDASFHSDCEHICKILKDRIVREEHRLYSKYLRIIEE